MNQGEAAIREFAGSPYERGLAQAGDADVFAVRRAVLGRVEALDEVLRLSETRNYLERQWSFHAARLPGELDELRGVAHGFGLKERDLFACLHAANVSALHRVEANGEGCSVWAHADMPAGPAVGKSRDFRGEHLDLQSVGLHRDAEAAEYLAIGSLGAPGAYSSGINRHGLALADTQIATCDVGVGALRYLVMTRLLARHRTVRAALDDLRSLTHAGGGSLVLADPSGHVAVVELRHSGSRIRERQDGWLASTNHPRQFPSEDWTEEEPMRASSEGRLRYLESELARDDWSLGRARSMHAAHDTSTRIGLCRHGQDGDSVTLSAVVYECPAREIHFASGNPCAATWIRIAPFAPAGSASGKAPARAARERGS